MNWFVGLVAPLFLLASQVSNAGELKLSGPMTQGGLIVGWASPGASIKIDDKTITQAKSGEFLLGFSRDAKRLVQLTVNFADGSYESRELIIKQRNYDIQRIDGLPKRKVTPNAEDVSRIQNESLLIKQARQVEVGEPLFTAGFVRPLQGRITGVYGSQRILNGQPRRPHYGEDVAATEGTPIKATSAGVVVFTHAGMYFNGKTVVINHGFGLRSTYIHMSDIRVSQGDRVAKGQVIGAVGQTGRATGPHLHWAVQLNNTPLDPALLFR